MKVGSEEYIDGDVTTLNWIGPRPLRAIETALGFGAGRLSAGYWVLVLKERLQPEDFELSGNTLRSRGRLGLPAGGTAEDNNRARVHDQIMAARGAAGYRALQQQLIGSIQIVGLNRIAKVRPVTRHDDNMPPDLQYPMGGGAPQWTLVKKKKFLVAMEMRPDGTAITPSFTVMLSENQPAQQLYANRSRVAAYLQSA